MTLRLFARRPFAVASLLAVLALLAGLFGAGPAQAQSRIKDIAQVEGVRDNVLVGYGLVVGLNGTGDDIDGTVFTRESLIGMLQRLGVNARDEDLETANLAAVMVTANLPPFSRQGSRIDVTVSALGTAESLLGGTLLVTPLLGAVRASSCAEQCKDSSEKRSRAGRGLSMVHPPDGRRAWPERHRPEPARRHRGGARTGKLGGADPAR